MARHIALFSDNEMSENSASLPQQPGNAIMTLVKPELSREDALRLMPQLPTRSTITVEDDNGDTQDAETLTLAQDEIQMADMEHAWEWEAHKHGWDYKFAISLITLLVIVNTGLVFLVHQDKGTRAVIANNVTTIPAAKILPAAPPVAATAPAVETSSAVPAQPAALLSIPEQPAAKPAVYNRPTAADNQDLLAIVGKQ